MFFGWLSGALAALALAAVPGTAHAQRTGPLEGAPPVRHKVEMRSGRFELTPQLMFSVNEDFRQFVGGSVVAQYHINDWIGLAAQFGFGGGMDTGLAGNVRNLLPPSEMYPQPSQGQFDAHLASINYVMSLYAALTPFAGKLSLFGVAYLRYDAYFMLGLGALGLGNANSSDEIDDPGCSGGDPNRCPPQNDGIKPGGLFGVGMHLYFNDWIGFDMEARDILASTNMAGLDVNRDGMVTSDDQSLANHLFFHFGITLMLPPSPHVSP